MRISRPTAAIIGLLTLWPPVYMFAAMVGMFSIFARGFAHAPPGGPPFDPRFFGAIMVGHLATMFVIMGLMVFYIVHVFRNRALTESARVLWTIVIFMGHFIAMPIYWYLQVWPR